jgi:hypothetical protein
MSDYVVVISRKNIIQCSVKCNMGQGLGKTMEKMAQNQMAIHNAMWARFVRWTRAQNKTTQYSMQQTFKDGQKNNMKT